MTRPEGDLSPYPLMTKFAMVRGIFVGTREHFDGLMKAVAVNKLHPVIDKTFDFDAAPEALQVPEVRAALRQGRHQDLIASEPACRRDIDNASCAPPTLAAVHRFARSATKRESGERLRLEAGAAPATVSRKGFTASHATEARAPWEGGVDRRAVSQETCRALERSDSRGVLRRSVVTRLPLS